jgi:hypothetical protein
VVTRLARTGGTGHSVATHVAPEDDMASVGIRELKHDTSAILRRVREKHETVT